MSGRQARERGTSVGGIRDSVWTLWPGSRAAWGRGSLALTLAFGAGGCAGPEPQGPGGEEEAPPQVATSDEGVVVAAQPLAAEAGARILRAGGNAADAAVAAAFAVSVVEPSMNSIGGRTQILVRRPDGSVAGIDATTQAPASYDPETAPQASYGYPTVGVPGAVAGLARLLREHGTLSLAEVMAPAIELAAEGFALLPGEAARHRAGRDQLAEFEGSSAHFLKPSGETWTADETFAQPDLAATLRMIAEGGEDAFYRGPIAERIVADMEAHGGAVTAAALAGYEAVEAGIVRGSYRGFELVGTDVPASGAVTIGILHILEHFNVAELDDDSWAALVGTAIARAFAERARPDEDGRRAPSLAFMTDKAWAAEIAAGIELPDVARVAISTPAGVPDPETRMVAATRENPVGTGIEAGLSGVTPPASAAAGAPGGQPGPTLARAPRRDNVGEASSNSHTTHLSTTDGKGMFVALTQTIGPNLGSKVATPGLGFLHAATLGGYLGYMEPGERARSSISPLMVLQDGEPVLVLGAAGGARIISAVVQAVVRVVDGGMDLPAALAAARVHPVGGGIAAETSPGIGWTPEVIAEIESWGIEVEEEEREGAFGRIHGIQVNPATGEITGVADPDWEGAAVVPGPGTDNS